MGKSTGWVAGGLSILWSVAASLISIKAQRPPLVAASDSSVAGEGNGGFLRCTSTAAGVSGESGSATTRHRQHDHVVIHQVELGRARPRCRPQPACRAAR